MIEVERRPGPAAKELLLAPARALTFGVLNLLEWPMRYRGVTVGALGLHPEAWWVPSADAR
jgi:hypothetical protein